LDTKGEEKDVFKITKAKETSTRDLENVRYLKDEEEDFL